MVRKIFKKEEFHHNTYPFTCDKCGKLFEAENNDFRYEGGDVLACGCPWCGHVYRWRFRAWQE